MTAEKSKRDDVIIVSGLPRSGTSMMMKALDAGGVEPMIDNIRKADEDNPKGYYEFERVKQLNEQGVTILLVEQNAAALRCADKAYILEGGEKKAVGSAQELSEDQEVGKRYLGR